MASSQGNSGKQNVPKDTQIIVSMMKDLGIDEYDQQVLNHLLEFNYRYTTQLLEDARTFSNFAKKNNVDADDVKMAIQLAQDGIYSQPPPRDVLMRAGREVNFKPLPPVKFPSGLRIPQDSSNLLQTNYRLRDNLYSIENMREDAKTTAAKMLEEANKIEVKDGLLQQISQKNNSMDINLPKMSENRQESIVEHDKDELKDVQACKNHPHSDVALDNNAKK